ncbi:hypothetical protein DV736_g3297, partial [Chaetothyriales sp. CBS 134916]
MKRARPGFNPPRPKTSHQTASRKSNVGERAKKKRIESSIKDGKKASGRRRTADAEPEDAVPSNKADIEGQDQSNTEVSLSDGGSPEPDYILAEITDEPASKQENMLSLPLIQRILQEHFAGKAKTRMTTDARQVLGKYIEIFVREAIMRSTYERSERDKADGTGGASSGWLEVEDLERIAPQLCLDF